MDTQYTDPNNTPSNEMKEEEVKKESTEDAFESTPIVTEPTYDGPTKEEEDQQELERLTSDAQEGDEDSIDTLLDYGTSPVKEEVELPEEDDDDFIPEEELRPLPKNAIQDKSTAEDTELDRLLANAIKIMSDRGVHAYLPSSRTGIMLKSISDYVDTLDENTVDGAREINRQNGVVSGIIGSTDNSGIINHMFSDKEAELRQGFSSAVASNDNELLTMRPMKSNIPNGELKGVAAVLKTMSVFRVGDIVQIPLVHSCFWVTVKPAKESEIIAFYDKIGNARNDLGRETLGISFSAQSALVIRDLVRFTLDHISSTTISDLSTGDIDDVTDLRDLPILIWGMARAIYPKGFMYRRACINDKCREISNSLQNLAKLLWVDNKRLSGAQRAILSKTTPKSITRTQRDAAYRAERKNGKELMTYKIGDTEIKLHLRHPTIREFIEEGVSWVDSVSDKLTEALASGEYDENREDELLAGFVSSANLGQWSHYVDAIEIGDSIIRDREAIKEALVNTSSDIDFITFTRDAIIDFRNSSVIASIGIPEYTCPKCGAENKTHPDLPKVTSVIPIDPINLYFLMLSTKFLMVMSKMGEL